MKIKKSPWKTEIEFTVNELAQMETTVDPLIVNSIKLFLIKILEKLPGGDKKDAPTSM